VRRQAAPRGTARRRNQASDLGARIVAAIPAIAFAILIVWAGGWVFAAGLAALGLMCLHELYTMLARTRPVKLAGFLALIGLIVAAHLGDPSSVLLVAVCAVPLTFLLVLLVPDLPDLTPPIAVTLFGIFWIGFAFAHAMLLRDLPHGNAVVIDVLVGTFVGDTGAYLGGRILGSRRLAPRLSPSKTWEGLACGVVTCIGAVEIAGLYQDWFSGWDALLLGLGIAIAAPLGDLFESALKRGAGAKDTGRLFGAHGGALDRLDAAMFTVVVGYWVWRALM
jgi:phosphatidate cytidylyltransferase